MSRPSATSATSKPSSSRPAPPKSAYVSTETGNKVSRRCQLHGTQHIVLAGRCVIHPDVCIRGDLFRPTSSSSTSASTNGAQSSQQQQQQQQQKPKSSGTPNTVSVSIGRYTIVNQGATLRPPHRLSNNTLSYLPLKIGDHVWIGPHAYIEAAVIESHCHVGAGAVVGNLAILKEGCKVLEGCVVPAGMVVPSGAVVGGRPARVVGEVGDGWGVGEGEGEGREMREVWRSVG